MFVYQFPAGQNQNHRRKKRVVFAGWSVFDWKALLFERVSERFWGDSW